MIRPECEQHHTPARDNQYRATARYYKDSCPYCEIDRLKGELEQTRVQVGGPRDYAGGNLLNVIDDVVCWFQSETDLSDLEIADILTLYAGRLSHGKQ